MIPSRYTSELWPQVPSSEAPLLNMSTKQLARQQSNEYCKAPWQTRLVTSGLLESSSTNNRARIPPPHVLQISSPTRPLASYRRHLISIRQISSPAGSASRTRLCSDLQKFSCINLRGSQRLASSAARASLRRPSDIFLLNYSRPSV
jgi:hypothetical protein